MKQHDCRAPIGGNAFDKRTIEAKMAMPLLLTWIKLVIAFRMPTVSIVAGLPV